ncbi:uncharacterized protein F4807DRAFT_462028 [Annulohypoxylon truncatum]|uniref:uncharacterized protein n=1 Tax=Annulohypoxylon truncatum TaxID=327061 RepID=UPI0020089802|nr:uncharacterized protein F4807DRAFT_462028 [Annulohypoxylon truncatum]KAI1207933.1 hypothetical protein F4807DRAFT_462028 [Annulohypoxylon truncatum]
MAMVPWALPSREQTYMPHTSSPLNPSNPEASPRRKKRNGAAKHEQSPTQRLMRQKAAVAWKTMSSRGPANASCARTTNDDDYDGIPEKQMDDSLSTRARTEHRPEGRYQDNGPGVRQIDMEKQALADASYREEWLPETNYPLRSVTTKRLVIIIGILCVVGILSAIRVVALSRIQAWRT